MENEILIRTAQAHFVVMALLEDYTEFIEHQTGTPAKEIKDRVMQKTERLIKEFKDQQSL